MGVARWCCVLLRRRMPPRQGERFVAAKLGRDNNFQMREGAFLDMDRIEASDPP